MGLELSDTCIGPQVSKSRKNDWIHNNFALNTQKRFKSHRNEPKRLWIFRVYHIPKTIVRNGIRLDIKV